MPVRLWQALSGSLQNELQHCVGIWMAKSLLRNEWPWAIQIGCHVIHTMASEWVTDTQHLNTVVTVGFALEVIHNVYTEDTDNMPENTQTGPRDWKINTRSPFCRLGWIWSVWSKSPNESILWDNMSLCTLKRSEKSHFLVCVCERVFISVKVHSEKPEGAGNIAEW